MVSCVKDGHVGGCGAKLQQGGYLHVTAAFINDNVHTARAAKVAETIDKVLTGVAEQNLRVDTQLGPYIQGFYTFPSCSGHCRRVRGELLLF